MNLVRRDEFVAGVTGLLLSGKAAVHPGEFDERTPSHLLVREAGYIDADVRSQRGGRRSATKYRGRTLIAGAWLRGFLLRKLYPERELFQEVSSDARLIVSEPLGDVAGVWNEVPESTWGVVGPDREETQPFRPKAPTTSIAVA
jgi:hypothetical protein